MGKHDFSQIGALGRGAVLEIDRRIHESPFMSALAERGIRLKADYFVARTNNHPVHWKMTKAGIGIGMMPVELGDAEPGVERVFAKKGVWW